MRDQRRDFEAPTSRSYKHLRERENSALSYEGSRRKRRSHLRWAIGITIVLILAGGAGVGVYLFMTMRSGGTTSSGAVAANAGASMTVTKARAASGTSTTTTTTRPVPTPSTSPAVLPPTGKYWFGMTVTNSTEQPIQHWTLDGTGGVRPMLGHIFILLQPYNFTTPADLADYFMRFFGGIPSNGVLFFTVEPMNGISVDEAPDERIQELADAWRELNIRGYKVLVRLGHEMNGGWYPWGRLPSAFQDFWIRFATIVRATAPITSLVWSPTISDSYPYDQRKVPAAGSVDMALLDTNLNGELDGGDDPYAGYWPGDEWVDWVGGSIYYYGPSFPYNDNFVPDGMWLERTLTGKVTFTGVQRGPSFYDVYSAQKRKPFIFAETAVYHWPNGTGATELDQKQGFWRLALNRTTMARFPMIRGMAWFELAKNEEAWQNQFIDFAIGNDSTILNEFLNDVTPPGNAAANIDTTMFQWGA
ncbi:glycoside hydrolase family 26 protein [Gonapodya prolifera JEL478]|uniref:Glycoside hydrolase family 26 protein n=1 Tax=Gonapodya prolifera (strain JEL478) TaxID=1344416 RepID=A0A139AYK0_GONPJ|nr:glycoside hydrolase family 26 protein [Gonapodya prolifera JEL478]|eukprot:KXS21821.1 glycoside hydrolase family 26 protein [Gonapodya prolifera JEL478]